MMLRQLIIAGVLILIVASDSSAQSDQTKDLESRLNRLELQVRTLSRQVAQLNVRIAALKSVGKGAIANANDMKSIYTALKISNARTIGGRFKVGDKVTVAYDLKNTSQSDLEIPVDQSYSRPFRTRWDTAALDTTARQRKHDPSDASSNLKAGNQIRGRWLNYSDETEDSRRGKPVLSAARLD